MTRDAAAAAAFAAKWVANDMGLAYAAGVLEDVEAFLACTSPSMLTRAACRAKADFIVPPGRRGRVVLVLDRPESARALSFAAALLRAVELP